MDIRTATESDHAALLEMQRRAFPDDPAIPRLVADLMADPGAAPLLSLVVTEDDEIVGHVLFSCARVEGTDLAAAIMAPVGVRPGHQGRGVGSAMIREGLARLRRAGCALVFVLGDPGYYGRFGFVPAGARGYPAPYPVPPEHDAAWQVLPLAAGPQPAGTVRCAPALDRREYWLE
ncbi:MAG: GNAT family N-acetyltransferase [Paracoccaceae bacterium]|jgi:predicted N-acetyltransferase YhbS